MSTNCNSMSLTEVTEYLVVLDTEDPEYAEKDKAASESRQDKGIHLAGKNISFYFRVVEGKEKKWGKKRWSIDAVMKTHRHC